MTRCTSLLNLVSDVEFELKVSLRLGSKKKKKEKKEVSILGFWFVAQ